MQFIFGVGILLSKKEEISPLHSRFFIRKWVKPTFSDLQGLSSYLSSISSKAMHYVDRRRSPGLGLDRASRELCTNGTTGQNVSMTTSYDTEPGTAKRYNKSDRYQQRVLGLKKREDEMNAQAKYVLLPAKKGKFLRLICSFHKLNKYKFGNACKFIHDS